MCVGRALVFCTTRTLLAASVTLSVCINPWKLVNGPASAVVASMMRFGTEFGTHKGGLSFASVGHGDLHAVLQDAYDRWTWERACNRLPALALVGGPPLTAPLELAMQHLRTSGEHLARGPSWARCARKTWGERNGFSSGFSLDRSCQLRQALVGARCGTDCYKCPASADFRRGYCQDFDLDKWLNRVLLSGVPGMLWTRLMLADHCPSGTSTSSGRCIK